MDDQAERADLRDGNSSPDQRPARVGKAGFFLALPAAVGALLGLLIEPG